MNESLKKLKIYLEQAIDPDVLDYIFFELNNQSGEHIGIIYCDSYSEELDNHCEQCQNELLTFRFRGTKDVPNYLVGTAGPTKFKKIINKVHNFNIFNFENAKFYNLLGEPINETKSNIIIE